MSAKELVLFIGGPVDGERREVFEWERNMRVLTMEPMPVADYSLAPHKAMGDSIPINVTTYERRVLEGPEGKHFVFVLKGMSGEDMILRLLDGYRKQGVGR